MLDRFRLGWLLAALLCCSCIWQISASSNAQRPGTGQEAQQAATDRATSFQAVDGARQETIAGAPLLLGAYGLVWLFVFAYLVRLSRLQAAAEKEQQQLEQMLARAEGADSRTEEGSR